MSTPLHEVIMPLEIMCLSLNDRLLLAYLDCNCPIRDRLTSTYEVLDSVWSIVKICFGLVCRPTLPWSLALGVKPMKWTSHAHAV